MARCDTAATLLVNDAARRAQWPTIAGNDPNITINVTYNNPDCCELHFLSAALPFRGKWAAHGFGSPAVRPLHGKLEYLIKQ